MELMWLKEALFAGQTANGFKLGTAMTFGWFWVRLGGCTLLYRGADMGAVNFENVLAVEGVEAGQIKPPEYVQHEAGEAYFYVVRRANGCGGIERTLQASAKVVIDGGGGLELPKPNRVFDIWASRIEGGAVRLVWFYCPIEQGAKPAQFRVCWDNGTGEVDYENPLAVIAYRGPRFYSFDSEEVGAGTFLFAVRAEDASGEQSSSEASALIEIDGEKPEAAEIAGVVGV